MPALDADLALTLVLADSERSSARKRKASSNAEKKRVKQKLRRARMARGKDAGLVQRHKVDGKVSSNKKNNIFVDVGSIKDVHIPSLLHVYGAELCESSLCSFKTGPARMFVCDCHGTKNHDLSDRSGPNGTRNWSEVIKLSGEAQREILKGKKR